MKKWSLILTLIWTCFILYQGSKALDVSLDQSNLIVDWIVEQIESYEESRNGVQANPEVIVVTQQSEQPISQSDLRNQISFLIRKGAYFLEYFLLSVLIATGLRIGDYTSCELIVYPLFFVLLLAISDEFLQSFVGRRSNMRDIVLDFSGGILGMTLIQIHQRMK